MKLKDILDKRVLYFRDTDDQYYWDFKYIVELDKDHVVLINHSGSFSGYNPLCISMVDEAFVSAFFEKRYFNNNDSFEDLTNKQRKLGSYISRLREYEDEDAYLLSVNENNPDFGDLEIIPIDKAFVLEEYNKFVDSLRKGDQLC